MLRAFNKMPDLNAATILVVGLDGSGKNQLVKAVLCIEARFPIQISVRTAKALPLPENNNGTRPRIDLIVFLISLTNRNSYTSVKQSLRFLDTESFVGKVCFVVIEAGDFIHRSVNVESVTQLAQSYCSPVLFCDHQNELDCVYIAQLLVNKLEMCLGLTGYATNILVTSSQLAAIPFADESQGGDSRADSHADH